MGPGFFGSLVAARRIRVRLLLRRHDSSVTRGLRCLCAKLEVSTLNVLALPVAVAGLSVSRYYRSDHCVAKKKDTP